MEIAMNKDKKLIDDKDLTGLTKKQIEKRKRMIAHYEKFGSPDHTGLKTIPKRD